MYVIEPSRQNALLSVLEKVGSDSSGWETRYVDPRTKEEWLGYYPYSDMHGGGPFYLRKRVIPDDWRAWIDTCLLSSERDDAIGLGTDIRTLNSARFHIVTFLEDRWMSYPVEQRRAFIQLLSFPRDSHELLGKHISVIETEGREERSLVSRIEALKKKA